MYQAICGSSIRLSICSLLSPHAHFKNAFCHEPQSLILISLGINRKRARLLTLKESQQNKTKVSPPEK